MYYLQGLGLMCSICSCHEEVLVAVLLYLSELEQAETSDMTVSFRYDTLRDVWKDQVSCLKQFWRSYSPD